MTYLKALNCNFGHMKFVDVLIKTLSETATNEC